MTLRSGESVRRGGPWPGARQRPNVNVTSARAAVQPLRTARLRSRKGDTEMRVQNLDRHVSAFHQWRNATASTLATTGPRARR